MVIDIINREDYELADKFLTGDKKAGEKLYRKVYGQLKAFVFKVTANSILTEVDKQELIEEILMISVEKLYKYNGNSKFSTFVLGIAKNKCREKFREKKRCNVIELDDNICNDEEKSFYNKDPINILIDKEEQKKIDNIMEQLKIEERQILQLRCINQMTAKQISDLTGENVEAIYSRYRRAIKKFRKIYEEYDQFL